MTWVIAAMLLRSMTARVFRCRWERGGSGIPGTDISYPGLHCGARLFGERAGRSLLRFAVPGAPVEDASATAVPAEGSAAGAGTVDRAPRARLAGRRRDQQNGRIRRPGRALREIRPFHRCLP